VKTLCYIVAQFAEWHLLRRIAGTDVELLDELAVLVLGLKDQRFIRGDTSDLTDILVLTS